MNRSFFLIFSVFLILCVSFASAQYIHLNKDEIFEKFKENKGINLSGAKTVDVDANILRRGFAITGMTKEVEPICKDYHNGIVIVVGSPLDEMSTFGALQFKNEKAALAFTNLNLAGLKKKDVMFSHIFTKSAYSTLKITENESAHVSRKALKQGGQNAPVIVVLSVRGRFALEMNFINKNYTDDQILEIAQGFWKAVGVEDTKGSGEPASEEEKKELDRIAAEAEENERKAAEEKARKAAEEEEAKKAAEKERVSGGDPVEVAVKKTLQELLHICKNVDFSDPKTTEVGMFYKAAPYIVYRGKDKVRKWKEICDYSKPEDKKGVDQVCYRINSSVNQDSNYKFGSFRKEKESEGVWHVVEVLYSKKGTPKKAYFAFLKIGERYALGDID